MVSILVLTGLHLLGATIEWGPKGSTFQLFIHFAAGVSGHNWYKEHAQLSIVSSDIFNLNPGVK